MQRKYETIDKIIEHGIYVYIFLMFLAKGEGLRNILIFGNFALWLLTLRQRPNLHVLKNPVSWLCWIYIGLIPVSVVFSIDPLFSLIQLKDEPLKFGLLFPVIATVMAADERRLKKVINVSFFALGTIVLAAYYSYFFHEIEMLKPNTVLVHAWHNKFARYLCTFIPISFILFFIWKKAWLKAMLSFFLSISALALILSTSRAGYLAFTGIVIVWALYFAKTRGHDFKKIISCFIIIFLIIGVLSYFYVPSVKQRLSQTPEKIFTLGNRTFLWEAAIHAIMSRPITGWGYGDSLFNRDEPFKETPFKKAPHEEKGPHNMFLRVLFHQGIIGLIPYVLIVVTAIAVFWRGALETAGIKSYVLVACVSILIGNYVLHSLFATVKLKYLAVVLGLGMAAKGINGDSHK